MNARGPHCELSGLILVSKTELDINKVCNTLIWNISNIYLKVITEGHEEFASKWPSLSTASQTNMACKSFA